MLKLKTGYLYLNSTLFNTDCFKQLYGVKQGSNRNNDANFIKYKTSEFCCKAALKTTGSLFTQVDSVEFNNCVNLSVQSNL